MKVVPSGVTLTARPVDPATRVDAREFQNLSNVLYYRL